MGGGRREIHSPQTSIRLASSSEKAYFRSAVDVQAGPLMRTARGALQIALLVSLLGEGVLGTSHSCGATQGGVTSAASLQRHVHNQPSSARGRPDIAAAPRASSCASFVSPGAMLSANAWRTAAARRVLSRPVVGLTRLKHVRGSGGGGGGSGSGIGGARRSSSTSSVAVKEAETSSGGSGRSGSEIADRGGVSGKKVAARQPRKAVGAGGNSLFAEDGGGGGRSAYSESLAYLSSPPEKALKGVGPRRAEQLAKLGVRSVARLLWHLPTGIVDRRKTSYVKDLVEGEVATVLLKVVSAPEIVSGRVPKITRTRCVDGLGDIMDIVMFGGSLPNINRTFPVGETKVVSGKVTTDKILGGLVMSSPDVVAPSTDLDKVAVVQPTYPLTAGLALSSLRSAITHALENLEAVPFPPEWIDQEIMREKGWPSLREALVSAHNPEVKDDLQPFGPTRSRLAYDELLASQLVLALRRRHARGAERTAHNEVADDSSAVVVAAKEEEEADGARAAAGTALLEEGRRRLPFELTSSQSKALDDIVGDMDGRGSGASLRMFRLLQGDVGSGKTAVAFLAMLKAAGQGSQSCLLAPTEVLTVQHLQTIRSMAEGIERPDGTGSLRVELLTASVKGKARQLLLDDVRAGKVDILVATHAVLASASTAFLDLGLAVVDEEQRFGVEQRQKLTGFAQHVLYLSATPIPRSLTLALYGDMEVSQIREMPQGAAEIVTTLIPVAKARDVVDRLRERQDTADKVFWVLPQINKSESAARQHLASATERYDVLVRELGEDRVSLLHGKMNSAEKNRTLSEFSGGEEGNGLRVLVSTSIIEVGVDVPRAAVCVVENAEMFGLSQLHQLRGRLGRTDRGKHGQANATSPATTSAVRAASGTFQDAAPEKRQTSHCILLYGQDITDDATERLKAIRATRDGFLLAERDLALRGPGEVLGVRQKGYIEGKFKVADLARQGALADHANKRARRLVESWVFRGDAGADPGGADVGWAEEGGGGGVVVAGSRTAGLGLLLALCGSSEEDASLLNGFASPTPWPPSPSPASQGGVAVGHRDTAEEIERDEAAGRTFEVAGDSPPSNSAVPPPASELSDAESPAAFTATAAGTPPAAYSLLDYDDAAEAGAEAAAATIGAAADAANPEPEPAETASAEEETEAAGMSAGERFRLRQRQQQDRLGERRRRNLDEAASLPPPPRSPPPSAGSRPSSQTVPTTPGIIRRADMTEGKHTVILFDLETTGLSADSNRIIQIAGKVLSSDDPEHVFAAFVDPEGAYLPKNVRDLTGITPEILAANKARPFREVWPQFAAWVSEIGAREKAEGRGDGGVVMIAHNAKFDHKFLVQEQSRSGFDRFMMGQRMGVVAVVDSLAILRDYSLWRQNHMDLFMPTKPPNYKLGGLFEHLFGFVMPGAHTALGDVHGLESVLSAPGISERWRAVAENDMCQIPVPRSLEELQAATLAASAPRRRKRRSQSFASRASKYVGSRYFTDNNGGGGADPRR
ncbi:unnamed protein product [Scytosiphon promiscuus]